VEYNAIRQVRTSRQGIAGRLRQHSRCPTHVAALSKLLSFALSCGFPAYSGQLPSQAHSGSFVWYSAPQPRTNALVLESPWGSSRPAGLTRGAGGYMVLPAVSSLQPYLPLSLAMPGLFRAGGVLLPPHHLCHCPEAPPDPAVPSQQQPGQRQHATR